MSLRPSMSTVVRKKSYKTGVDADQARRRSEDNLVEIRKNKREDNLLKKRREGLPPSQQQLLDGTQTTVVFQKSFFILFLNLLDDLPQVALLYGNLTEEERKRAQEKVSILDESITDLSFPIASVALYKTNYQDKTLKSWEKIAEKILRPR